MRNKLTLSGFFLGACLGLTGCAGPQTGTELATVFGSGVEAYDAGDYAKAYKIWSGITDRDIAAMRNVAMMLRTGQGVRKDPAAAELMFERAAEAGLPTAQADLADMLIKGEAGPPDTARALPLLQAAAAANHPLAQYELGRFYETGTQVPQDEAKARALYAEAARHGVKDAADRLAAMGPAPNSPPQAAPTAPVTAGNLPPPPVASATP
jgi:TPR repeat protein